MNEYEKRTDKEIAYSIIDEIDEGVDYNLVLNRCLLHFPDLDWNNRGEVTLRQFILDEVINK